MKSKTILILILIAFILPAIPTVLQAKGQPDDYQRAAGLAEVLREKVKAYDLPFRYIEFSEDEKSIEFTVGAFRYSCDLETYACKKVGPADRWRRGGFDMWQRGPAPRAASEETKVSPGGKWEAFIKNYNVAIRLKETGEEFILSHDGSEGNYYTFSSLAWSPDSKKIAAFRLRRGFHRIVHYVESSPKDQLQPKYHEMEYAKPGDALDIEQSVLFRVNEKKTVFIDNCLFPNPYEMSDPVWRKDSRAFSFEYNQRGHQVYRIIEVNGTTGKARALISEEPETRIPWEDCSFIRISIKREFPPAAATITGWTKSGGMSSGWAGRWARNMPLLPMWTTPTGSGDLFS